MKKKCKCKKHTKKSRSKLSKGVKNLIIAILVCFSIVGGSIDVLIQFSIDANLQSPDSLKGGNEAYSDIEGLENLIQYKNTKNLGANAIEYILKNNMY